MDRIVNIAGAQLGPIARNEVPPTRGIAAHRSYARC